MPETVKKRKAVSPLCSIKYAVTCTSADVSNVKRWDMERNSAYHTLVLNADQSDNNDPDVMVSCLVLQVLLYFIPC